ncbi:MAG: VanZ family protein [Coriobacteriia bacterium]|nr:VanZ family protein [Coriobacteriia bacterium]
MGLLDSPESSNAQDRSDVRPRWCKTLAWAGTALWAATIFALSSIPGSDLPPGEYSTVGHFALYFVLSAVAFTALDSRPRTRALSAIALASAYGISDELHQLFVPGRCADPVDWLVDTAGAVAAATLILLAMRVRASRMNRQGRSPSIR